MRSPHERPDRRRVQRIPFLLDAAAREPARSKVPVRIVDISTHGCRIEVLSGVFAGSFVWLTIPALETQRANLIWQSDGFAGLEFTTPLDEAVLKGLIAEHGPSTTTVISELRDLARRTSRLSSQSFDSSMAAELRNLSRDCSVRAIVCGFKTIEQGAVATTIPELSGAMVRRRLSGQQVGPGFSFSL